MRTKASGGFADMKKGDGTIPIHGIEDRTVTKGSEVDVFKEVEGIDEV